MDAHAELLDLGDAGAAERARVGGKAGVLGELAAAGLPVPPGFVVTAADLDADGWEAALAEAAGELGGSRFAVRSSGAAEDLPDASYAGLYETYLNVPVEGVGASGAAVFRRCWRRASLGLPASGTAAVPPRWRSWCRRWSTRSRPGWRSLPIR